MTTTDEQFTDTGPGQPHERLWPEQVVELLGLASTDSLRATAGRSRQLARRGKLTVHDLPVEDGRDKRKIPTGEDGKGPVRTVWQSWWYRATIEAHLPHRRGRGTPGKAKADAA
jgi:hypothetical protein